METRDRIIVALDTKDPNRAFWLVKALRPFVGGFKLGLEFFTSVFAQLVTMTQEVHLMVTFLATLRALFSELQGLLFWDGKWADIPNTIGGAAEGIAPLKPKFVNIHASAGVEAMMKAVANKGQSRVLAVTVLTSLEENNAHLIFGGPSKTKVLQFARDAKIAGCDGIICSPQELEFLGKQKELKDLLRVTPGVRPLWAATGDQKRIMTPAEAIKAGADYLVIGRPITAPPAEIGTPVDAAKKIAEEIDAAL